MSDRELRRLEVLQDLDWRRLTAAAAGQLLVAVLTAPFTRM